VPGVVRRLVETVRVEEPVPPAARVMLEGLSDVVGLSSVIGPVTVAVSVAAPVNPLRLVSEIVDEPEVPALRLILDEFALIVKSGGGGGGCN